MVEGGATVSAGKGKEGAGAGGRGKRIASKKKTSASVKAERVFPMGRIGRYLRKGRYAARIGAGAAVFLTASLE